MRKNSPGDIFYVYEHWRLDREECFYVGKGTGGRAYKMRGRNRHHAAIMAKVSRDGSAVEVRIVKSGLSEAAAFALESERIAFWRAAGADLANMTQGGEGISGFRHSDSTKKKLSEKLSGVPSYWKGKKMPESAREKLSLLGKARGAPVLTDEQKQKVADWHRGRKRSPETCAKISAAIKGRPSPNKGKPSPFKGVKRSDETREKIRLAKLAWWSAKKLEGV